MSKVSVIGSLILFVLCVQAGQAQAQAPARTVLDGVYSEDQAERGKASYASICGGCHGYALEGVSAPRLTGNLFIEQWREGMLDSMYNFMRRNMPPPEVTSPRRLTNTDYLDIVTYILKVAGYPAGAKDLTADAVGSVMVVGKNGPQPVPDGALVVTVGCLFQRGPGEWALSNATEPARTRTPLVSTREELAASSQQPLGALTFRLDDLAAVSPFSPDAHKGHKMQAKGYMIRSPNADRIGLTLIEMLDSTCGPK